MPSGGARAGAGRKSKPLTAVRKVMAEEILGAVDEVELWKQLVASDDLRIRLDSLKYLTDRRDGKAPQAVDMNHSGSLEVIKRVVSDL